MPSLVPDIASVALPCPKMLYVWLNVATVIPMLLIAMIMYAKFLNVQMGTKLPTEELPALRSMILVPTDIIRSAKPEHKVIRNIRKQAQLVINASPNR